MSRISKIRWKSGWCWSKARDKRVKNNCLVVQILLRDNENVLELDRGAGHTTLNVLNASDLFSFKQLKWLILYYLNPPQ